MGILINGRVVECYLTQNLGIDSGSASELDLSPYLTRAGTISWAVDEALTKLSPGNFEVTVCDPDNVIWNFITSNLTSSSGILPPWLTLIVDGVQRFCGVVKEAPTRSETYDTDDISISAVDWSSMLESKRVLAADKTVIKRSFNTGSGWAQGPSVTCYSVVNKELRRGHDRQIVAVDQANGAQFRVGDWVYFANYSSFTNYNAKYQILSKCDADIGGIGTKTCLQLASPFWWSENAGDAKNGRQQSTIYRLYQATSGTEGQPIYVAAETIKATDAQAKAISALTLSSVEGLLPGDVLEQVTTWASGGSGSTSLTLTDIDPVARIIYFQEMLSTDVTSGVTTFKLSLKSMQEASLVSIRPLVEAACGEVASVDWSAYATQTLTEPIFSWISAESPTTQQTRTEVLAGVSDIQAGLSEYEVSGAATWIGTPEAGWAVGSVSAHADWTEQLLSPPAYLLPIRPEEPPRDRQYTRIPGRWGVEGSQDEEPTPTADAVKNIYDYSTMRCWSVTLGYSLTTVRCWTWNGSTWTTISVSKEGLGSPIEMVPMPGYGLLALYADGTVKTFGAGYAYSGTLTDAMDSRGRLQAQLKQTPLGVYYLTPGGYGKITVAGGALSCPWVRIVDPTAEEQPVSITPITSTFTALSDRLVTLAKVSYKSNVTDDRTVDETYLLQLNSTIAQSGPESVFSCDYICGSVPRTTQAVRSPDGTSILGFMGSRLYQISRKIPETIERFSPINQTAQALLEFACSVTNSVAIPVSAGKLKMYSRGYASSATNIAVDVVSRETSAWSKHLADCIVIKGANDSKGVAVSTSQKSGITISLQNDVWIRNNSQARAIAKSYLTFFEKPRKEIKQDWVSFASPAPWEALSPMQVIRVNGDSTAYYLTGLEWSIDEGKATATLLQV